MELRDNIVKRFGVSIQEADRLIAEAQGRREIKTARAAALRGETITALPSPEHEDRRRKYALGVLKQGVAALTALRDHIDEIIGAENTLITEKIKGLSQRGDGWWDMRESGWSGGGREHFAHCLCDVLQNLDETTLSRSVNTRLGFHRAIVLPEELRNPVTAETKAPVDQRLATFEAAMLRVSRSPGVEVMDRGPVWRFRFSQDRQVAVSAHHYDMVVTAMNSPFGQEPRGFSLENRNATKIARLVEATVKELF